MKQPSKAPSIQALLQYQKQQHEQLISAQQKNPAYFYKEPIHLTSKQKINPWQQIDQLLKQSQTELQQLKSLPLKYGSAMYEYNADKIRNQISRNKLKIFRLEAERKKLLAEEERQCRNLDLMLEELDKLDKQVQDLGIKEKQQEVDQQSAYNYEDTTKFEPVEDIFQDVPQRYKQKYMEPIKNSHLVSKPIELFNMLSSRVMETDRQISFLMSKKYEEETAIQSLTAEYKAYENKEKTLQAQIQELKVQQQKYGKQVENLEKQLKIVNDPNHINLELIQRIQLQQQIYEEQCKRLYLNIMKLRKLIQLSGNIDAVKQAENVMSENNILKSL